VDRVVAWSVPSRAGGPAAGHLACRAAVGCLMGSEGEFLRAHARPSAGVTLRPLRRGSNTLTAASAGGGAVRGHKPQGRIVNVFLCPSDRSGGQGKYLDGRAAACRRGRRRRQRRSHQHYRKSWLGTASSSERVQNRSALIERVPSCFWSRPSTTREPEPTTIALFSLNKFGRTIAWHRPVSSSSVKNTKPLAVPGL